MPDIFWHFPNNLIDSSSNNFTFTIVNIITWNWNTIGN